MFGLRFTFGLFKAIFNFIVFVIKLGIYWFLGRKPAASKPKKEGWLFKLNWSLWGGFHPLIAVIFSSGIISLIFSIPAVILLGVYHEVTKTIQYTGLIQEYYGGFLHWIVAVFSLAKGATYYPKMRDKRKKEKREQEMADLGPSALRLGSTKSVPEDIRKAHMYVVGKTGSGKSKAMQYWLTQDVDAGRGCAIIDAHGDVVDDYLAHLADGFIRRNVPLDGIEHTPLMRKIVIVDPTDPEFAVGINPLQTFEPFTPMDTGGQFEEAVKKLWGFDREEAPLMGEIIRFTAYALSSNHLTLMEAVPFLTDKRFRFKLANKLDDEAVKDFLIRELTELERGRMDAVGPARRRIRRFTTDKRIAPIIGQKKSTLRLRDAMDEGCVILCKIPTTLMGETGSFLGALLVSQFYQAARSRSELAPAKRNPFYLYIDEFQKFVSGAFPDILSEMRKYGLHFILAHQYSEQVDEDIQNAIYKNTKAMVAFRVDADDSMKLSREFFTLTGKMVRNIDRNVRFVRIGGVEIPTVEETEDYFNLNEEIQMNANVFTKLNKRQFLAIYEGIDQPVGDLTQLISEIDPEDPKIKKYIAKIREVSHRRWARPREDVLKDIKERQSKILGRTGPAYDQKPYTPRKKKKKS